MVRALRSCRVASWAWRRWPSNLSRWVPAPAPSPSPSLRRKPQPRRKLLIVQGLGAEGPTTPPHAAAPADRSPAAPSGTPRGCLRARCSRAVAGRRRTDPAGRVGLGGRRLQAAPRMQSPTSRSACGPPARAASLPAAGPGAVVRRQHVVRGPPETCRVSEDARPCASGSAPWPCRRPAWPRGRARTPRLGSGNSKNRHCGESRNPGESCGLCWALALRDLEGGD